MAREWGQRFAIREGAINRVLVGFMAIGFLALVVVGVTAAWVTRENRIHADWVAHTYRVENAIAEARRLIEQGETTRRGVLLDPANPDFAVAYRTAERQLDLRLAALRTLVADNRAQGRRLAAIEMRLAELRVLRRASMARARRGDVAAAIADFRAELTYRRMRGIRDIFDAMQGDERRLLGARTRDLETSVRTFYGVLVAAGILLALVALVSLLAVLGYTGDLARSRDVLQEMNDSLEDIVRDRTADLSRANEEIQRFAYIVSHDLRSPLVNVMGFTAELEAVGTTLRALVDRAEEQAPDLVDEEARLAAREDLPEAIGFIRSSTQKMDRLINAILTLSRQGRRTLTPEPVALADIVDGIRDSLAHRLESEGATIEVGGNLPILVTDRLAIEQILSNLVENAVKYGQSGRELRVIVTGGIDGARAWVAVTDNGRGIDPRDHERVFDLFRRSGMQDQPGEGIGLAHVRALAYRLGGAIDLRSTLGAGSTFRVTLPATLPQEPHP